ncbi:MAG: hypothetical protein HEQ16_10250 [Bosea sp.]|nr:hypothetical protein [Bosea sp. (in: a-proteobacteria)]
MPAVRVRARPVLGALAVPLLLAACQGASTYPPGSPERAAAAVSRGYDCGLRVERRRVVATYRREERRRFLGANQSFAVQSYNAPRACGAAERGRVAEELRELARR